MIDFNKTKRLLLNKFNWKIIMIKPRIDMKIRLKILVFYKKWSLKNP
jgi:hypothetical protein